MDKMEFVKKAYEAYLETTENERKIVVDLNGFDYCEECKNNDGELNIDLVKELNELLIKTFEENGYTTYMNGDIYPEDGQFKNVAPDTVVAILYEKY